MTFAQRSLDFDPAVRASVRGEMAALSSASKAERLAPGWQERALDSVRFWALHHETFLAEDVRHMIEIPESADPRAIGHVLRRARAAGICRADGYAPANSSNRSPKVRWRSLVYCQERGA